jgi:ABC-type phosphate/phosphonate transport system substrate-binding protein
MIAGLPMYDPPELQPVVDAWWSGLARAFRAEGIRDVPERLDRTSSAEALWGAPNLLFAQSCGFPLLTAFAGRLRYLATPRHAAPGCDGDLYCSWIDVPADSAARTLEDLRGARCSINGRLSHSGYNALRALVAPLARDGRFFGSVGVSGGHRASLVELAAGATDVAAIDCVTYALLGSCRPQLVSATRIIGRTASAPGLPYVAGIGASSDLVRRLRAGLFNALADPHLAEIRDALLIAGLDVLPLERYACVTAMAADAARRNYIELG